MSEASHHQQVRIAIDRGIVDRVAYLSSAALQLPEFGFDAAAAKRRHHVVAGQAG